MDDDDDGAQYDDVRKHGPDTARTEAGHNAYDPRIGTRGSTTRIEQVCDGA